MDRRISRFMGMAFRIVEVVVGVFLAYANGLGNGALGFIPMLTPQGIGFDLAKFAIYYAAGLLIYRGFKPRHHPSIVHPPAR